jgi:hypothetical protein
MGMRHALPRNSLSPAFGPWLSLGQTLPQFFRRTSAEPKQTAEFPRFFASGKFRTQPLANGGGFA